MSELAIVDLSHLFWSAWHGSADQPVSAAFESTIARATSLGERHELVAIAVDSPPYFRKSIASDYKANREAAPEMAREQLRRVIDRLARDGYVIWQARGFEADDIIAGACEWAATREDIERVVVASNDKDLLQLVGPRCSVLSTRTGDTIDATAVEAKFGVAPNQIRDLLALTGDRSDNVPGVPGVGPKKAAALLLEFGSLDAILAALDTDPGMVTPDGLRRALTENRAQIELSRMLVTLRTDASVDYEAVFAPRVAMPLSNVSDAEFEDVDERDEPEEEAMSSEAKNDPAVAAAFGATVPSPPPQATVAPKVEAKSDPKAGPTPDPGTAIVRVEPGEWSMALEPTSAPGAYKMATYLFNSRLYAQFSNAEAIFAVILRGRALGLDATTSLANFHVVEGRPTMHADLIRGLVMKSGLAEYFDLVESTRERATWATKRKGARHETKITWTIEDAHAAGLVEKTADGYRGISKSGKPSNWDKYRPAMLRHRSGVELSRAVYPDVTAGLYDPSELNPEASVIEAEFEAAE